MKFQYGIHDNEKDTGDIDQAESSLCAVGLHELLCGGDFFKHEFPVPSNPPPAASTFISGFPFWFFENSTPHESCKQLLFTMNV